MHSDGASQLYTPTSPLSPIMSPSMKPLPAQHRPTTAARPMRLSALPRFHPAAYQSPDSTGANTPQPNRPSSPLHQTYSHRRIPSDTQRALRQYQKELIATARHSSSLAATPGSAKPSAPRLDPLGSPGPVTPLELGEEGGYLIAGAARGSVDSSDPSALLDEDAQRELVERLIEEETRRKASKHGDSPKGLRANPTSLLGKKF